MDRSVAACPKWLEDRINQADGSISFSKYMDWALNDPEHGAYGSGRLRIGKKGDFITSPSLGPDFAELLALQLLDWFKQIEENCLIEQKLSLVDVGPGEGDLSRDLILSLKRICPEICQKLNLILIETNKGMEERQRIKLASISFVEISWLTLEELQKAPIYGVVLAHELLDALPVERIVYRKNSLLRQGISIIYKDKEPFLSFCDLPLSLELELSIKELSESIELLIPPFGVPQGWSSEWHIGLEEWFKASSKIIKMGTLLVIDYALEAKSYYNKIRSSGTILAYKDNISCSNILREPGFWDITSHLCLESLNYFAQKNGFNYLGRVSQGLALLSLGLAKKLHSLHSYPSNQLSTALEKREDLLRLVDPSGLGTFSWIAFQVNNDISYLPENFLIKTLFLQEPIDLDI